MKKLTFFLLNVLAFSCAVSGTSYYCDPAAGNMSNPGSSASPWSTLEEVFKANKTFQPGDVIYLRNGYHGFPSVKGNNSGYVTIQPESSHNPKMKKLTVSNASRWVISGLTVSPEVVNSYEKGQYVDITSSCSYITLKDCYVYSALSITGWGDSDWTNKAGNGILCSAPNSLITNNLVKNTNYGIRLALAATSSVVSYNTVENFCEDAYRGLSDYAKFEYNVGKNAYQDNGRHHDLFQSWSGGSGGAAVGTKTVTGVELRGNIFISHTDKNQPLKPTGYPQGIGCFDGMYKDWIVENNLVMVEQQHGISFLGAINCKVLNNTVVENPVDHLSGVPGIRMEPHKDGRASNGNLVRNNFTAASGILPSSIGVIDHNIVSKNYTVHFVNYAAYDCHLKSGSSLINAGSNTGTPSVDLEKNPRTGTYDIGCYEYGSVTTGLFAFVQRGAMNLTPNPTTGSFTIHYEGAEKDISVTVIDLMGKTIISRKYINGSTEFIEHMEINSFPNGIYFIKLETENLSSTLKLIKQ